MSEKHVEWWWESSGWRRKRAILEAMLSDEEKAMLEGEKDQKYRDRLDRVCDKRVKSGSEFGHKKVSKQEVTISCSEQETKLVTGV